MRARNESEARSSRRRSDAARSPEVPDVLPRPSTRTPSPNQRAVPPSSLPSPVDQVNRAVVLYSSSAGTLDGWDANLPRTPTTKRLQRRNNGLRGGLYTRSPISGSQADIPVRALALATGMGWPGARACEPVRSREE